MKDKLIFNINNANMLVIGLNQIIFFEKNDRKIKIYLNTFPNKVLIDINMKNLRIFLDDKKLFNNLFYSPHYSYILNINFIRIINTNSVLMSNGIEIPISNNNKKFFIENIKEKLK